MSYVAFAAKTPAAVMYCPTVTTDKSNLFLPALINDALAGVTDRRRSALVVTTSCCNAGSSVYAANAVDDVHNSN